MQPFSINANLNKSDVLEFPAGARTSRASYDADQGAAKFSQFAKPNASPIASRNREDFTPNHSRNAVRGLITVPTFQGAFVSNGLATEFPYFMIGTDPAEGTTTTLPTKIVSFALNLHDANGGVTSISFAPSFSCILRILLVQITPWESTSSLETQSSVRNSLTICVKTGTRT